MNKDLKKLKAVYASPLWGNPEIAIVTGFKETKVSLLKRDIMKKNPNSVVKYFPSKLYRDDVCKYLNIDYTKEIDLINKILEGGERDENKEDYYQEF